MTSRGPRLSTNPYQVTGKGGFFHRGKTDAQGDVEMEGIPGGAYQLEIQGHQFQVPTLTSSVLREDPTPYTLIVK